MNLAAWKIARIHLLGASAAMAVSMVSPTGVSPNGVMAVVIRSTGSLFADPPVSGTTQKEENVRVVVGGFVRDPGPHILPSGANLWQAIRASGGCNEFGSMRRVRVMRNGILKQYDLTKPEFQNLPVETSDCIEVPQKEFWGS